MPEVMDIVIPFIESRYNEIRYALRSIEKHMDNVGEVFIIGDALHWMKNVTHIGPVKERSDYRWKESNCHAKLMMACVSDKISNDFLYMNDDHFLLSNFDAEKFPNYYSGMIRGDGLYGNTVVNTAQVIGWVPNYDVHCPMIFNKDKYVTAMSSLNWLKPYGYLIKSTYAYKNRLTGVEIEDCKMKYSHELPHISRQWFSCSDLWPGWENGRAFLQKKYPHKSKYEV